LCIIKTDAPTSMPLPPAPLLVLFPVPFECVACPPFADAPLPWLPLGEVSFDEHAARSDAPMAIETPKNRGEILPNEIGRWNIRAD
jgi:hypothetical protein